MEHASFCRGVVFRGVPGRDNVIIGSVRPLCPRCAKTPPRGGRGGIGEIRGCGEAGVVLGVGMGTVVVLVQRTRRVLPRALLYLRCLCRCMSQDQPQGAYEPECFLMGRGVLKGRDFFFSPLRTPLLMGCCLAAYPTSYPPGTRTPAMLPHSDCHGTRRVHLGRMRCKRRAVLISYWPNDCGSHTVRLSRCPVHALQSQRMKFVRNPCRLGEKWNGCSTRAVSERS